jgi:dipeptidyl aminopeptidase/acylaminoacyl peptidase
MVVEVHGGPTDATPLAFRFWGYGRVIFPARGYALLSPNYRGSTGYSDKFMTDLIGRENDVEVKDILAGVDAMAQRGVADPERLGVMGWSNGGFLTNCLITSSPRFKAASSGAGVLDQFMQWATEDTPGHVINYMRGLPWDKTEAYVKGSPAYRLNQVRTPTLIHVGEKDERVPAEHARALYRALREYLGVPSELLVYPDQPHGLGKASQRMAKMEWDLAWFDKYVRGEPSPPKAPADSAGAAK